MRKRLLSIGAIISALMVVAGNALAQYTPKDYSSDLGNVQTEVLAQIADVAPIILTVAAVGIGLRVAVRWIHHLG